MKEKTIEEAANKEYTDSILSDREQSVMKRAFIKGANWQKEQLLNEIIEAFKLEGIHYTKEFLLKLLETNKKK